MPVQRALSMLASNWAEKNLCSILSNWPAAGSHNVLICVFAELRQKLGHLGTPNLPWHSNVDGLMSP